MKYFILAYRSVFFYIIITIAYRLMGKREIGELSIMDFIVSIFIAEMVAISIENYNESMFLSLVPVFVLVILEIITSYLSMKSKKARDIIEGIPSVIIDNGIVNFKEMKRQRYNIDDLLNQLRNNSIKSIEDVRYAVLEASGKLSIFKKDDKDKNYPLPVILDGKIDREVLNKINKNNEWIYSELDKRNLSLDNIIYGFYKDNNLYLIDNK